MCSSTPKTPDSPAPLAAAPTIPGQIDRGTTKKKSSQKDSIKTNARGIYQPLMGSDTLG